MFAYYGRKMKAAPTYPAPEYPLVIEPFAGSLAYTLHHRPQQAIGIERDERIVNLWRWLCSMTADEIASLREPIAGERLPRRTPGPPNTWVVMSSASSGASAGFQRKVSSFMVQRWGEQRRVALKHLEYAKTVLYSQGDYRMAPDVEATWFIDPPYQQANNGYRFGASLIDYDELARWCRSRKGQVIVCEGSGADWLPFKPHRTFLGRTVNDEHSRIREYVWYGPQRRRIIKVAG